MLRRLSSFAPGLAVCVALAACSPSEQGDSCAEAPEHLAESRFAEAETAYQACLAAGGHEWEAEAELRLRLAAARMGQARHEAALDAYDQVLALLETHAGDASHAAVRRNRALALYRLGRPEAALEDVEMALARSPHDVTALMIAGAARLETGADEAAAGAFSAVLARNPDDAAALAGRSAAYAALGRHDAALADALDAVSVTPSDAGALNALCWALVQAGRAGEALPTCDAALEARPDSGAITHSRAAALEQLGRMDEARDLYARAFELDPVSREIAADYARTRQP